VNKNKNENISFATNLSTRRDQYRLTVPLVPLTAEHSTAWLPDGAK
jgi:hypothetical protein